jgi:heat shock protein HslJ
VTANVLGQELAHQLRLEYVGMLCNEKNLSMRIFAMGKRGFLWCVLVVVFLMGCGKDKTVSEALLQSQVAAHIWELEYFVEGRFRRGVATDTEVTLLFSLVGDVGIHGQASCNFYGAPMTLTGNRLDLGPIVTTEMFCLSVAGAMEQEARYLKVLQSVRTFQVEDDRLTLFDGSGNPVLRFASKTALK